MTFLRLSLQLNKESSFEANSMEEYHSSPFHIKFGSPSFLEKTLESNSGFKD